MDQSLSELLLIEDNPGDARLIREMLVEAGTAHAFWLTLVDSLAAGLARLDQTRPDLLLLDLSLSDSHGLETFERVQAQAPGVPIIVLTGLNDETVALQAVHAGAQDYLVKGEFEGPFLARAIRYAIERKHAEEALRESETFLQSTLDSLLAHIAILDESGVIVAVNGAWRRFAEANQLRMDNYGLGANYLAVCDGASGDQSEGAREAAAGIRRALTDPQADFYLEYSCHSPAEARWFAMRVTRFDNNGKVVVAHENITRRKQAEENVKAHSDRLAEMVEERTTALRQTQAELVRQEKMATLGHLAASISHELRNPLGVIKNAAYFLNLALTSQPDEVREALTILEKEVNRSEQIIRSLLDFGQARPPVRRKIALNSLIEEALAQTIGPGTDWIDVSYHQNSALPAILADPDQMRQVFGNIILNAIQAMNPPYAPETGQKRLIITSGSSTPAKVEIIFRDTGVGIAAEELDRIFEPLFTTKAKGIGLGLALAKSLVEAHGGNIRVESEKEIGSTFIVSLPTGITEPTEPIQVNRER